MKQAEALAEYIKANRPKFNQQLLKRTDDDMIRALKNIILSIEREGHFTIKVLNFEIIDDYDEVNRALWEYEENIINKSKSSKSEEEESDGKQQKKSSSSDENIYNFINLKDSYIKLLKVTYFISIYEKKNGYVSDTVSVYIGIPRIIDNYYYYLNGNIYSTMYQIVDASTYNNSQFKNAKKQSVCFKTTFMAVRLYRIMGTLKDIEGNPIQCAYFMANMFKKTVLVMKYIFAKMGYYDTIRFFHLKSIYVVQDLTNVNTTDHYVFPTSKNMDSFIVVPKILYNESYVMQSLVYTIYETLNVIKNTDYKDIFTNRLWLISLGSEFSQKDIELYYNKGISILGSLEFIYDIDAKEDLKLDMENKADIYRVLRWMIYEFPALRVKDNLDIRTKKIRYAESNALFYAIKLSNGIYRLSDKGDKADLQTVRQAIMIQPMYLINKIIKSQLTNYNNCVNDMDSIIALKYTYKGPSGIGEKSNAIPNAYRLIHPSHLGRVDIDSSSNSDPGVSGTLCPLTTLHGSHFEEYEEPNTWESEVYRLVDKYNASVSQIQMCRLVGDAKISRKNTAARSAIMNECLDINRNLLAYALQENDACDIINGYDMLGCGHMFVLYE